ncbi:MAG: hypothetical protein WDZ41_05405 [Candidatus Babeliales bacterium]
MNMSIKLMLLSMLFISFAGANVQAGITDWFPSIKTVKNGVQQAAWHLKNDKTVRKYISDSAFYVGLVMVGVPYAAALQGDLKKITDKLDFHPSKKFLAGYSLTAVTLAALSCFLAEDRPKNN